MANVLELKNLKNKVSRNGFDLSERRSFTAKVGELLPCFVQETLPGDHFNINPSHFTRTMPVNTAAYTQLREYVHFYFVPYRLLHSQSDAFFADNKDNPSRAASISSATEVSPFLPYLTVKMIFERLKKYGTDDFKDVAGMSAADTSCKLLQYLGYGDFSDYGRSDISFSSETNMRVNPFALLAYQKIYQDYFRNQSWEKTSPHTCNIDYLPFGSEIPLSTAVLRSGEPVNEMLTMRYCNFNKDYFFGVLPEAQYGDYVVAPSAVNQRDFFLSLHDTLNGNVANEFTSDVAIKYGAAIAKYLPGPSVLALRKAEALQKYREIRNSGDKDYKTYLDKIFNVGVSDDRSDICRYLGGYNADVNISEVVNTNLSTQESQASISGKGMSSGGTGTLSFDAREHGLIIGIYTCRPTVDYSLTAPSKMNLRLQFDDFANPVFDRVGMETVHMDEIMMPYKAVFYKGLKPSRTRLPVGYVPRYASYKTSYDKILGAFRGTLSSWVSPVTSDSIFNRMVGVANNSSDIPDNNPTHPGSGNLITAGRLNLTYENFKVTPDVVDSIFVNRSTSSIETDQLLVNMSIGCPVVRNLDYDGLPY
uniref:Major capsid protein n=1 Tax=Dulem virus 227 TaxID=3145704 RepID=A0AAU8B6Z5_9VIRU